MDTPDVSVQVDGTSCVSVVGTGTSSGKVVLGGHVRTVGGCREIAVPLVLDVRGVGNVTVDTVGGVSRGTTMRRAGTR